MTRTPPTSPAPLDTMAQLERKILWLSAWMIHNANHLRAKSDDLKVGGHQASCASITTIMTALYMDILRPQDRVAVKPHASPVFHAIQYLLGQQSLEALKDFRAFGGAQSYPSRTKDADDVDFSTGSVGLGVAMTAFASLTQDYLKGHGWLNRPEGRMVALAGDAEFDEGNIFEALQEGYRHDLRNTWWVIDYNRQSLDAVVHEQMHGRYAEVFRSFGWDVKTIKYGRLLEEAFERPGGGALREWIDTCANPLYSALTYRGAPAWRDRLEADLGNNLAGAILADLDDAGIERLMTNLGGHDLSALRSTFRDTTSDRPTAFIAYTIKGFGTPLAGHKDNHGGLMTPEQMDRFRQDMGVREGHEWDPFEGVDADALRAHLDAVPFAAEGRRRYRAATLPVPEALAQPVRGRSSTQLAFGKILDDIGRDREGALASRIVTTSPDVTVSTGLGPWVNRRGRFSVDAQADVFRDEKVPSMQKWAAGTSGQHLELGIAENNFFTMLAALGLSHSVFGERLLPVGTLYDPFVARGLDALNYACYQDARFMVVGTPSGISLAPEGGAHQSINSPLIGMAQDGLASFEPAFADELEAIMRWSFDYLQRDADALPEKPDAWDRDAKGGSVYLRLSTRTLEQPARSFTPEEERAVIDGGYWMRPPGPNCELVVAYSGAVAEEAMTAVGLLSESLRDIGLLAVTSPDRLSAGWHAAARAREDGQLHVTSHVERLLQAVPRHAGIITVCDAYPATLEWLGSVNGNRTRALGVESFGQSGSVEDLYAAYGIDAQAIMRAARISVGLVPRAIRG
ncbi:transketolase [Brevirhabdus pacifica]|uniref:Pyruvate dehydrogenase E1 component n=1 Tax=Brevirhabdus pacifica TaxID=1267768 RepID=A0A1U7DKG8_9RHOB|nr:transketolase [Brevirhabdus pacifica]APX90480.1 transketolase [Brevirhabdus pacifica]OWU78505.1 transketolase [Loktanella sp. 22II-4b]PJJ85416.1 pyruvate dehydrogenase E1 component [Brevirhabdus pacifica]